LREYPRKGEDTIDMRGRRGKTHAKENRQYNTNAKGEETRQYPREGGETIQKRGRRDYTIHMRGRRHHTNAREKRQDNTCAGEETVEYICEGKRQYTCTGNEIVHAHAE